MSAAKLFHRQIADAAMCHTHAACCVAAKTPTLVGRALAPPSAAVWGAGRTSTFLPRAWVGLSGAKPHLEPAKPGRRARSLATLLDGFTGDLELLLCLGGTTRYLVGAAQRRAA